MNIKTILTILSMFLVFGAQAAIGQKDTVMIYQPGPGANDTTDDGSINAGKDTWADEFNNPIDQSGNNIFLVRPISNCNNTNSVGYIRFDLGNLPDTVDSVFVGFYHHDHTNYCYSGCSADFYFARIDTEWYENKVTYSNKPTIDTPFYGPIHLSFPNSLGTVEYNITDVYRMWRDSTVPNYGMAIYSNTVTCNNASVAFFISTSDDTDATKRPYLKIHYKVDTGTVDTNTNVATIDYGKTIKVYPNPARNEVWIDMQLPNSGQGWYALADITGKVILKENNNWHTGKNTIAMPIADLQAGVYFYTLYTPEGRYAGKILKQ